MMLDFRIATFLKLCETKSYTNTAKLLHITQPSVTQHIKYLQKRYQCQLFTYEGKTLRLTPEGEYLRRQAQAMTMTSAKVLEDLQRISSKRRALRFGCTKALGETVIPRVLGRMLEADEDLELVLTIENTATLTEMLESGRLDFILTDKTFAKSDYITSDFVQDRFCCWACPKQAEMLQGISLKRLFREKLLVREQGSGTRMRLEQYLEQKSFDTDDFYAVMECSTSSSIQELTAAGVGISFGYESCMQQAGDRIARLRISDFNEECQLAFMYLKDNLYPEAFTNFFASCRAMWETVYPASTK